MVDRGKFEENFENIFERIIENYVVKIYSIRKFAENLEKLKKKEIFFRNLWKRYILRKI